MFNPDLNITRTFLGYIVHTNYVLVKSKKAAIKAARKFGKDSEITKKSVTRTGIVKYTTWRIH